jgi:diguanylate cyclase
VDEYERAMSFAQVAMGQIKALHHKPNPRNFEIWFTYASGQNAALNKAINDTLARGGTLTEAELEQICEIYFPQTSVQERIDSVGSRVMEEIDHVRHRIVDALSNTTAFDDKLADAAGRLAMASDRDSILRIVEALEQSTRAMQENNRALETRLRASKEEISTLHVNLEAIRAESFTDQLTSLSNRKYFDRSMEEAVAKAKGNGESLSLAMLDIDHFKKFNDNYGHLTGDQVLRLVASTLKLNIKGKDVAARYGGEEFAIILPSTALRQALTVADQIRRAVMARELKKKSTGEFLGRITISIGVATLAPDDDIQSLIGRADACLYAAKRNGRNRVICEADPEYRVDSQTSLVA